MYLEANPAMRHWTFEKIMTGATMSNKVTLRGQLHDALVHASSWGMDRLIKAGAMTGIEVVPLANADEIADHEIENCDGCKAKMTEKAHASTIKPYEIQKNDAALDFQEFSCPQVGTNAKYGFVLAMLYFCFPVYCSVGPHHTAEEFVKSFEKATVKLNHQQKVDLRDGRFGIGQVITDFDSVLRAKGTREHLAHENICQRFSTPYAHWQNPAENYMKKSKDGMLALLNNAGLPDSLQEVCFNHSTYLQGFLCRGNGTTRNIRESPRCKLLQELYRRTNASRAWLLA